MITKLKSIEQLTQTAVRRRAVGQCMAFTNGCFDLLHAGHVRYLTAARAQADYLVVGLNSDASTAHIKGPQRPIVSQAQRAEVLSGLWCVNYITYFEEPDPLRLIMALKPDVLVKGADWPEDQIIGADVVKQAGGRVVRVDVAPAVSSSALIQRILQRYGPQACPSTMAPNGT